jgi:homoaconitase/3-isopropylmalate dehydratase large subunit
MGMTMTQKILAAHSGKQSVAAGDLLLVDLDMVLGNDVTTPVAINEFNKMNRDSVFDTKKISLVMDHFAPSIRFCQKKDLWLREMLLSAPILIPVPMVRLAHFPQG